MSSGKPPLDDKAQIISGAVRDIFNTHNRNMGLSGYSPASQKRGSAKARSELELALTVLLVELASADQSFEQSEYQLIANGLKSLFGTPKSEIQALVNQANNILANLRGTSRFAELLRDNLTEVQRQAVVDIINEMIAADGREDGFEVYLRNKIATILGFPPPLPTPE